MEWQQLEYFCTVARLEHFTRAANELAVTQPALSRSIARLEAELGVLLFEREGWSVRLNRYGRIFLRRAERALAEIREGMREIKDLTDPNHGTVALAFLHTLGTKFIPSLLRAFRRDYPRIRFHLCQNAAEIILAQLETREIDLCFTSPPVRRPGIGWADLLEEELYVLVPAGHRLAGRGTIELREVAKEPLICVKHGYGLRSITEDLCRQAGFTPRIAFEGEEVATIAGLVAAGLGIALIPEIPGLDPEKTVLLRLSKPRCRRVIGIAWAEGRFHPAPVEQFMQFTIRHAASLGQRERK
jgi:DNA-binding transcriptional LysR family regulator